MQGLEVKLRGKGKSQCAEIGAKLGSAVGDLQLKERFPGIWGRAERNRATEGVVSEACEVPLGTSQLEGPWTREHLWGEDQKVKANRTGGTHRQTSGKGKGTKKTSWRVTYN